MTLNLVKSTADYLVCECGNIPESDGYYSCMPSGKMCEPDIDWDGYSYICARCHRIYDIHEMREVGRAHPTAIEYNKKML